VVTLNQAAAVSSLRALDEFRGHMEREGAVAVGLVAVNRRGGVLTQFSFDTNVHALAGGTMNLLRRIQTEGMDW
jgi:hypothetical protein